MFLIKLFQILIIKFEKKNKLNKHKKKQAIIVIKNNLFPIESCNQMSFKLVQVKVSNKCNIYNIV
jgi:hypothetical protein